MHSGSHHLVGQFVGPVGSARPVSKIIMSDGKLRFSIPPQWEKDSSDLYFEALFASDSLVGKMTAADGIVYNWTAHRAPLLKRTAAPVWNKPVQLLQAGFISGWHALGENQWKVEGGVLSSPQSGSNLVTDQVYTDFKLHIEFRCPKGSNSGIYLRGRYEVQIEDSKGKEPQKDLLGAVYGFLTPNQMAAKSADEWQTFDIVLVGRLVTITANGKEIICRQTIPGITGDSIGFGER